MSSLGALVGYRTDKCSLPNYFESHGRGSAFDMPIREYLDGERFCHRHPVHGFGLGTMREDTQWARPVASDFVEYAVIGLLQRIRPRAQASGPSPGQDGDTRAPVLINFSASSAVF